MKYREDDNALIQSAILRERLESIEQRTGNQWWALCMEMTAYIAVMLAVLLLLSFAAQADEAKRPDHEAWFAACLNGVTIQVWDVLFQCLPAGKAK